MTWVSRISTGSDHLRLHKSLVGSWGSGRENMRQQGFMVVTVKCLLTVCDAVSVFNTIEEFSWVGAFTPEMPLHLGESFE